jgi:hypothetical protein
MMGMHAHFVRDLQGFEGAAIILVDIPCQQAETERDLREAERQTGPRGWGLIRVGRDQIGYGKWRCR